MIVLLVFVGVILLVFLVRLIRRLAGWSKPETPEIQYLDSGPAFVWLRFPVCLRHWCFRPGGIRLIRADEHTLDLAGVSFAFIKDCQNAGLRILEDPGVPPSGDPSEDETEDNGSSGEHA